MWAWVAVVVGALIFVPVTVAYPIPALLTAVGVAAGVWLARQGAYRFALGLMLIFALGAISTIPQWASVSVMGRPAAQRPTENRRITPRRNHVRAVLLN